MIRPINNEKRELLTELINLVKNLKYILFDKNDTVFFERVTPNRYDISYDIIYLNRIEYSNGDKGIKFTFNNCSNHNISLQNTYSNSMYGSLKDEDLKNIASLTNSESLEIDVDTLRSIINIIKK